MNKPYKQINSINHGSAVSEPWLMVNDWYHSVLGQELLAIEKQLLNKQLEQFFGYNLVQLGYLERDFGSKFITNSKISNQIVFESIKKYYQLNKKSHPDKRLICNFSDLPLQSNSIDVLVLPHTLEFESNPHQIIREVERVLMPEAKVIFFTFNPYGLWGLLHKYWQIKFKSNKHSQAPLPSCGNLISHKRLKDWLQLLGFDIEDEHGYFYRPPLQNSSLLKKFEFMEKSADIFKLIPAGSYMTIATKRVSTLTPIRESWRLTKTILGAKVAQQPSSGFRHKNIKEFK